jgi:hypothetical protein
VPAGKLKKKYDKKILFYILKSLKKGVGSGSISQRYGSRDPDPRQNVKDPQHCLAVFGITRLKILKSSPLLQRCYRAKARRVRPQQQSPRSCASFPAPHSSCPASCPAHGARAREEVPLVRKGSPPFIHCWGEYRQLFNLTYLDTWCFVSRTPGRGVVDPYRTSCVVGSNQIVCTSGTSAVYLSAGFPTVLNWYSYLLSV